MRKIVKGVGPKDAALMIIGEAPGAREIQEGQPFVGRSGQTLSRWLQQAGLRREECYLDNLMHVRPPGNNFGAFYEDRSRTSPKPELVEGVHRLKETINEIKPNAILSLGNEPLRWLTGNRKISVWRGSILPTEFGKVIPTYHPSYILRGQFALGSVCVWDVKKAAKESLIPEYEEPFEWDNLIIPNSFEEALRWIERGMEAEYLSIDLEATMGTRWISHFGFAFDWDHAVSIRFYRGPGSSCWDEEQETELWFRIAELCGNPSRKIFQNSVYDIPQLNRMGIHVENLWMDTMIAHVECYAELPKGLDFLTSIYTNIPYYYELKDEGSLGYTRYNCLDCLSTYRVAMGILQHMKKLQVDSHYFQVVHPSIEAAIYMQEKGLRCDEEWRREERERLFEIRESLQKELNNLAGWEVNADSTQQCQKLLYEQKGIPPIRHRQTNKPTTNEDALLRLMRDHNLPEIPIIWKLRHITKLVGTYYDMKANEDGRLHSSWNVAGTITGRWSSSKTAWNTGGDFQNIPVPERRMIIPDEGKVFLYADLAQAEMRVVAWISGEESMKQAFKEGKDVHRINASNILGIPEDQVTPKQRYAAKQVGHAANYDVKARTFSITVARNVLIKSVKKSIREPDETSDAIMPNVRESEVLLNNYFTANMRIRSWQNELKSQVRKARLVRNPLGRQRLFLGIPNDAMMRQALDQIPQSTIADLIDIICTRLIYALPKGADLLLQNHDAVLVQCRKEHVNLVSRIVHNAADITILDDLNIPIEVKTGENWRDLSDEEE